MGRLSFSNYVKTGYTHEKFNTGLLVEKSSWEGTNKELITPIFAASTKPRRFFSSAISKTRTGNLVSEKSPISYPKVKVIN